MTGKQSWVSLSIDNVMGVKAVSLERKGAVTTVGGKNRAGKSSVIKSLWMALGGASCAVDEPLREGARKGEVTLELTDYVCTVKLSAEGKPKLSVKAKGGSKLPQPMTFLKTLTAGRSFKPAAFYSEKPDKQLEILQSIVTTDTAELDADREFAFEKRTEVGRDVRATKARMEAAPFHPGAAEEEASISTLIADLTRRRELNEEKAKQRLALDQMRTSALELREEIEKVEEKLEGMRAMLVEAIAAGKKQAARVAEQGEDQDTEEIEAKIQTLEDDNRKARENTEHKRLVSEWETLVEEHEELTATIKALDEKKAEAMAAVKFPVDGLGFGDGCVLYHGRPLDQACGLERMRVSLGIGMAQNPGLRLLTIDDEEKLDEDEHANLIALAESEGFDLIVARVSRGPEVDVIIEDGEILND